MHKKRILIFLRRGSQLSFLVLFGFLFIKTDYTGSDHLEYAVNIFFRLDPLVALCTWPAQGSTITFVYPALLTVVLTLILGRFFCGWFCPMGTLLDASRICMPDKHPPARLQRLRPIKYYLLIFLVTASFFGLPLMGFLDPFSILVRGLTLSLYPSFNALNTSFFTYTYQNAPEWVNTLTEPVYALLKNIVLPFQQKFYDLSLFSFSISATVFLLELLERRFFCRNLCPLGGLLALLARFSPLKVVTGSRCGSCGKCRDICRLDAIDEQKEVSSMACNLCMDCVVSCPGGKITLHWKLPSGPQPAINISRRGLITGLCTGVVLPFTLHSRSMAKRADPALIRPPGAVPEDDFLIRCVRCGECMKVCIGNGLHPCFLEAGLEGMFTPKLKPRIGYCEYNCTLCGQVCPTGAIERLSLEVKHNTKIGHAHFDKNRCLPHAKSLPCIVCEEHCPTPDKAIKFQETMVINNKGEQVSIKRPYLVDELCIGCGICETICPLPGRSAITLTSAGEQRNPAHALPVTGNSAY